MPNPVAWSCIKTSDYGVLTMSYSHLTMNERSFLFKILPNPRILLLNVYHEDHGQIVHFAFGCS